MKRILSDLFAFVINYSFFGAVLGVGLMASTLFFGPVNIWLAACVSLLALALAVVYQLTRPRWPWQSPGEAWLGNNDKNNIALQAHDFTVTRWPLLLLVVVTVLTNGNLLDGLTEGANYRVVDVLLVAAVLGVQFATIRSFLTNASFSVAVLLAFTLFGLGMSFQLGNRTLLSTDLSILTAHHVVALYKLLALLWLLLGWIYARRYVVRDPAATPA